MPLVANSNLPSFLRLTDEGKTVISKETALHQDIRELHIGLLNMMPDAALEATERQFFRLVGESNPIAQFYMHPFTLKELKRNASATAHIEEYYEKFEDIKAMGLDGLIITGANVTGPNLSDQPFWEPLKEVVDWAYENVTSTLCSCLATHAVMEFRYKQKRTPLKSKRWGVFPHRVVNKRHPLVYDVNTRFDVPHSRHNEISKKQFEKAGLNVLVESEEAGVHLAVSADLFRLVMFQGHPEYDSISLLKEYKREVVRFGTGERQDYPPFPQHYLTVASKAILNEYREHVEQAIINKVPLPAVPEHLILEQIDNTWHDTAEAVVGNWIGSVYQLTHHDRKRPFADAINPDDPFGLRYI
jgi:homoserine O-succinyltransferase